MSLLFVIPALAGQAHVTQEVAGNVDLLGNTFPATFLFSPSIMAAAPSYSSLAGWGLALILALAFIIYHLNVRKRLGQQEILKGALTNKAQQIVELQQEFGKMADDLNYAKKTVERKSRDLKMINHILDLKVERKTKELQEANTDLSTFLYRSSHDILGPMARLTGLCNLAQMEVKEPTAQGYLQKLASTAQELNSIIHNIQDVFNIKNRELVLGTCNLLDTIHEIIEEEFEDDFKRDVQFDLNIESDLMVTTDIQLLRTVFMELIKNSLIHRSSYREVDSRISIQVERKPKKVLVTLDDNGSGIPSNLEEKVFDMFQRTSELAKGTGMGLYIVKCALQRMRGNIAYQSKDEPGARFVMQIPNFQTL